MNNQRITAFIWFSIFLILISFMLSAWQFYRLQWKQNLLDTLETRINSAPISLEKAISDGRLNTVEQLNYLKLKVSGVVDAEKAILQIGRDHLGTPGYYVLAPMITPFGWLFVNLGNVKFIDKPDVSKLRTALKNSNLPNSITGIVRPIKKPQWYFPDNAKNSLIILSVVLPEIASLLDLDLDLALPFVVWSENPILPAVIDSSPSWTFDIANNHFVYALTWLAIGIGIIIVSILWVRQKKALQK